LENLEKTLKISKNNGIFQRIGKRLEKRIENLSQFFQFGIGSTDYFDAIIKSITFPALVEIQRPGFLAETFTP
jgi:hypothetical protein